MRSRTFVSVAGALGLSFSLALGCGSGEHREFAFEDGRPEVGGRGGEAGSAKSGGSGASSSGGQAGVQAAGDGGAQTGMDGATTVDAGADAASGAVDASVVLDAALDNAPADSAAPAPVVRPVRLIAYDGFGAPGRLQDAAGGTGWRTNWLVNNDLPTAMGYAVTEANPLTYKNLLSTPSYAVGGHEYRESGRGLDVSPTGPFAFYRTIQGRIGTSGEDLWISFLYRKTSNNDDASHVTFHNSDVVFWDGEPAAPATLAFGFFGADSKTEDMRYWSLRTTVTSTPVKTNVALEAGRVTFVVMNVSFTDGGGTVKLFLNPSTLGTDAPSEATAEVTSTTPLAFSSIKFHPGNASDDAAIDEIRIGPSFATVTPTNP